MTERRPFPEIPPVSDYAHWNEDAELMWYQENKYDMEHQDEMIDNWLEEAYEDRYYDDSEEEE